MIARRTAAALAACLLATGCAVGGGTLDIAADRPFELSALEAIVPGMAEAEVVDRLGLPAAFGVDERGRRYLQYAQLRFASSVLAAGTGVVGVNATSIQSIPSGFQARVFIEGGRVARVAIRVHGEPAAGGSAGAPGGQPSAGR